MQQIIEQYDFSERRACSLIGLNRRTYRRPISVEDDAPVRQRMRELAQDRPRFGAPRLHVMLRREGLVINHKRTERLYREEGLSLRGRLVRSDRVTCALCCRCHKGQISVGQQTPSSNSTSATKSMLQISLIVRT